MITLCCTILGHHIRLCLAPVHHNLFVLLKLVGLLPPLECVPSPDPISFKSVNLSGPYDLSSAVCAVGHM